LTIASVRGSLPPATTISPVREDEAVDRATEQRLLDAVADDDRTLRTFAIDSFLSRHSQHPGVVAGILDQCERRGLDQGVHFLLAPRLHYLAWTLADVERVIGLLERTSGASDLEQKTISRVWASDLQHLPARLIVPFHERIAALPVAPHEFDQWLPRPAAEAAAELERHCRTAAESDLNAERFPFRLADALVAVLAESPEFSADWVLNWLHEPIPEVGDSAAAWLEPYVVDLACRLRLVAAVPALVDKVFAPDTNDFTLEVLDARLVRIGTDDLVRRLADRYDPDTSFSAQLTVLPVVSQIDTELAERTALDWLDDLSPYDELVTMIAEQLLLRVSPVVNDRIAAYITRNVETQNSLHWEATFSHLKCAALLTGQEFPQHWEWHAHLLERRAQREREQANERNARYWAYQETDFFAVDDDYEPVVAPPIIKTPHVGRNDPCPCGSGKKFKKCCIHKGIIQ
jgi:hypothetical protein